jgi:HD-GYP domain-containing protein (c-di-GMP phosphodiesterase class II)
VNSLLQPTFDIDTLRAPGLLTFDHLVAFKQEEQYGRLTQTAADVIARLVRAFKTTDQQLFRHCYRVRCFTDLLTKPLRLAPGVTSGIRLASLFHDIGKLRIPSRLLNKPGSLTRREFEQIKRHPAYGAVMLHQQSIFAEVVPLVLCHHEHWNGLGYPHGLQRNSIPLGARIIAIADAFEVMTSAQRVYQRQRTSLEAIEELVRCAGTQFDPALVDLFCASLRNDLQTIAC